ncbi:ankyrin repeat domain-containing protein [Desulfosudis oleivorans]|nr:ankyrin repeat domain-containing protein [Desulfosudis oleivorans]
MVAIGCTQLNNAAQRGDIDTVNTMIDRGADVNAADLWGITALQLAAQEGHVQMVQTLIEKGADVNKEDVNGWSVLAVAASSGHVEIVKLLIENGADVEYALGFLTRQNASRGNSLIKRIAQEQEKKLITAEPSQTLGVPRRSDIDEIPGIKAKPNHHAYAIIIGIENYRQNLPKADFADQDALIMSRYLTKAMGYPEENVVTLLNDHASNVDLVKYFEKWLPNNVEPGSTVFVYFSGHGAPDPKTGGAYLVPYDGDPTFIAETGYSLSRLYDALGKLPAKEIIVALDSCFSGAGGRSVLAKGARPLVMNLQTGTALSKNMTVLAASSGDQISSTYDEKGHGLFTYFMLKGIKNEDVVNPDGSIKMDDLYGYLKPQVERIARKQYNNEQTPQLLEGR